jgi:tetratricopeptide (TPR) repeat protein
MVFVGRELELDRLQRELALALNLSTGRSVFVQGAAGTGKSALVAEFLERVVRDRPGVTIGRGRCLQTFGSADPYLPFVEALRDLSDETTAGFVKRETLSEMIAELTPYWLSAIPMVGNLLSAGYATARKLGGGGGTDAAPSREALFIQYLELLQGLATQAPLILFLDDLQWADQSSIALLNHICRGLARQPVLIIATVRNDEAEREKHPVNGLIREVERESLGAALNLTDLEPETFARLLRAAFQGDVSEPLQRWMQGTAGSNPLFATELVRLLKESGAAEQKHGEWHLTVAIADLSVPRSAEAVVEGRLQALDAEEIKLLQYASIEGTEFNSMVLAAMLEEDELDLLERLEKLDRRHHLVRTSGEVELPDGEVATLLEFRHTLLQTVLYRQIVGKRRILLHRKAGECLERIYPDSTDRIAGKLARHLHEGRVKEGAYRYACAAADAARRIYAHWEAEEYLKIAIQHSPGGAETVALLERLADVYVAVGYYDQASTAFQGILDNHETDARMALRLRRKLATVERRLGSVAAPILLQRFRGLIAEAAEVPEERCHLLLEVGFLPNAVGVVEGAEEAVAIAESLNDSWLLAKALDQLAWALILGGRPREGLTHLERAYATAGGASDPIRTARYHNIRGVGYTKLGMFREAYGSFEQMLVAAEKLAEPNYISVACSNMGCELLKLGEYARAEEVLNQAFTIHQRRDRAYMLQSLFNLAKRAHWSGEFDTALRRYSELLELATELGYWTSEAVAHAGLGLCLLEVGRVDESRDAAAAAAAVVADRQDWFEDREFLEMLFARLESRDGDPAAGADRLIRAAESLEAADLFAFAQVRLERIRILKKHQPENARAELAAIAAEMAHVDFALAREINQLASELLHEVVAPLPSN